MTLFDELTPPPGGLEALRVRIAADEARTTRRRRAEVAVVALALAATAFWAIRPPVPLPDDPVLVAAMGLGGEPVALGAGERGRLALTEVPLGDARVVYARIDGVPR